MTLPAYLDDWRPMATFERPRGVLRFYRPTPGVVLTHITGHVDEDAGHCFTRNASAVVAGGLRHRFFHDWEELIGYEPGARQILMRWSFANMRSVIDVHALIRSKIVAMGWAAAALALGQVGMSLRACTSRDEFEGLVVAAVRQAASAQGA